MPEYVSGTLPGKTQHCIWKAFLMKYSLVPGEVQLQTGFLKVSLISVLYALEYYLILISFLIDAEAIRILKKA